MARGGRCRARRSKSDSVVQVRAYSDSGSGPSPTGGGVVPWGTPATPSRAAHQACSSSLRSAPRSSRSSSPRLNRRPRLPVVVTGPYRPPGPMLDDGYIPHRCGSGRTPEARSPTWSTTGGEWRRCCRPRRTPTEAVRAGIAALRARRVDLLTHGTTVATNALLEGALAPTALVTHRGLRRRHRDRPPGPSPALRPVGRPATAAGGAVLAPGGGGAARRPTDRSWIRSARSRRSPSGTAAVAVCLLHADLNADHEAEVAAALRAEGHEVSASHEVSPEFREYERTVTTVVNAGLGPVCRAYLEALASAGRPGAGHDLGRRTVPGGRRRPDAGQPPAVRAGRRGPRRRGLRRRRGLPRRRHLRHGRDQHRRGPGPRRRAPARGRAGGGGLPDPSAVGRRPHDRGGRRVDRRRGRGRGADRRPPVGRGGPRAGLLRARGHGARR